MNKVFTYLIDEKFSSKDSNETKHEKKLKAKPGNKSETGEKRTKVEINPLLKTEESIIEDTDTAVIAIARMQPPTRGHDMLVQKVLDEAENLNADPHLFLSGGSKDPRKNPIHIDEKFALAYECYEPILYEEPVANLFEAVKLVGEEYTNLVLVAGSDRAEEYKDRLNKYNGIEFNFESIRVVSAGERDDDNFVSGTMLRKAAWEEDYNTVQECLAENLKEHWEEVVEAITGKEVISEERKSLSAAQRQKKRMVMKKNKVKIKMARKRQMRKRADTGRLKKRARRMSISAVKRMTLKKKGGGKLSIGDKRRAERMVQRRSGLVNRLSKRNLKNARKMDRNRRRGRRNEDVEVIQNLFKIVESYSS